MKKPRAKRDLTDNAKRNWRWACTQVVIARTQHFDAKTVIEEAELLYNWAVNGVAKRAPVVQSAGNVTALPPKTITGPAGSGI